MLFKILHGDSSNISTDITPFHEGWCYVTHDGCFYFDMNIGTEDSPNNQRIKLNAKEAEKITGYDIKTILNSSDIEIPTSKAVLDALSVKADIEDLPIIKDASEGTISLTWDGEIGDKDHFQFGTLTYCKQSDMTPAYSSVTGGYTFRSNGMQNTSKSEGVNCYAFGDAIVVTTAGACSKGGTQFEAPSTGIYFGRMSGWYTEELEMDCDIIYNSLATTDVNGTKHKIAVDENNLLSVTDMSNDSTVYMATTSYVDGKLNETVNPDWNEQDPDSKAYIENRPFYEIPEEKVIISNKQRKMSATSGTSTNSYYINYNNNIIAAYTYSFIAEGQQCKLSYTLNNGSTVEITGNAKHYSVTSGYQYEYYVFGNQYLLNGLTSPSVATNLGSDINSGENTAVIFVLAYYNGTLQTPNCCIYVVTTDIGMQTASLVLSVVNSDVVQLNERFIPDTIARVSDIPTDYLTTIPAEYITETELNAKGYLTEHQSLAGLATEQYVDEQIAGIPEPDLSSKQDKITGAQGQVVGFDENGNAIAENMPSEVIISDTEPTDENIKIWINPNEDDSNGDVSLTDEITNLVSSLVSSHDSDNDAHIDIRDSIPKNVSQLNNDSGYLTEHQSLAGLATESYVNSKIASIPTPDVSGQINTHNTSTSAHADIRNAIPTKLSQLTNDLDLSSGTESITQQKTLTTSGWTLNGGRYQQSVSVTGVTTSTPVVIVDCALDGTDLDADATILEAWGLVSCNNVSQGNGSLTFYAYEAPTINIPVNVGVA